jgi:adenine deaminase
MATLNTAEHFGVARQVGQISPGRWADILLVPSLPELETEMVIARGRLAAEGGKVLIEMPGYEYPEWARQSVHLGRRLEAGDFRLSYSGGGGETPAKATANVIGVIENQAPTRHLRIEVPLVEGEARINPAQDLAKIALVERHRGTGRVQVGLVQGFGFSEPCATGSTVAHDSHHMIVVGTHEADMALAANRLAEIGGGQVVVRRGEVIGEVDLPIGGLMSPKPAEVVARRAASVLEGFKACGCRLNNPNMQLSLLALVVIPELRLSDLGLVDVTRFELIPALEAP